MSVLAVVNTVKIFKDEDICKNMISSIDNKMFTEKITLTDKNAVSEIKKTLYFLFSFCLRLACC